jgi:hypothetical protein
MEGLFAHAAQLHSVELRPPPRAIGRNTVDSLRSGAVFGYVGLVEGLVRRIQLELGGKPVIIATGGLATAVIEQTRIFDTHDPELTLHGLRMIYQLNPPSGGRDGRARAAADASPATRKRPASGQRPGPRPRARRSRHSV